jgi:hypothetical protein
LLFRKGNGGLKGWMEGLRNSDGGRIKKVADDEKSRKFWKKRNGLRK